MNLTLPSGTLLGGKYFLLDPLPIPSTEGDFYLCTDKTTLFMAKLYHSETSTSAIAKTLIPKIQNPHIAKIITTGKLGTRDFEILPHFKNGSIDGKPLTIDFIRKGLIPSLNEALQTLHKLGIRHKDIKPAHIMFLDNWTGIALIDCGNGASNSFYKTQARSPDYAAPETYQQLFLPESDYYSFGVTLFQLCCGYNPYHIMSPEERDAQKPISSFSFPDSVPQDLRQLITGLTYWDVSKRNDKTDPDRRWTYDEVKNWCMGKSQTLPGGTPPPAAFQFLGKKYTDLPLLLEAFIQNWDAGKKELYSGNLENFFKLSIPDYLTFCQDAQKEVEQNPKSSDSVFWKFIYQLHPSIKGFYWKNKTYPSLKHLGHEMMTELHTGNTTNNQFWTEILQEQLLSAYLQLSEHDHQHLVDGVTALEISYSMSDHQERNQLFHFYTMAYLLSGELFYKVAEDSFHDPKDLYLHMINLVQKSFPKFEDFCHKLIDDDSLLDVQLESWLLSLGNDSNLEKWQTALSH